MPESSTYDYLIKKLYQETEPTEDQAIEDAFLVNLSLKEKFEELKASKKILNHSFKNKAKVSQKSINRIMEFSQLTSIVNHKN